MPTAATADNAVTAPSPVYDASSIKVLKGLDAVRKRPGMYIGDVTDGSGLHHMLWEVVDNSVDEHLAEHGSVVRVVLEAGGHVRVEDEGRGMPVDRHPTEDRSALEVLLCELHAGGKFDDGSYKVSGGLHGVGVSVVNALSESLEVFVRRDGGAWRASFERGEPTSPVERVGDAEGSGTTVRFLPDAEVFGDVRLDVSVVRRRLDVTAGLCPGLTFEVVDERVTPPTHDVVRSPDGLTDLLVRRAPRDSTVCGPVPLRGTWRGTTKGGPTEIEVEAVLAWTTGQGEDVTAYTNLVPQPDGGTHVTALRTVVGRVLPALFADLPGKRVEIATDDVREGLVAIVSLKVPDPSFSSQTKEKLVTKEAGTAVSEILGVELPAWFARNPDALPVLRDAAARAAATRERIRRARQEAGKASALKVASLPGKLVECQSRDPRKRELFVVEGDSAGGSVKQGRDRTVQALLPLRGKILNVERASFGDVVDNAQIGTLVQALGTGIGDGFDPDRLRYHTVVIMTDADVDGAHIRSLLLTFFLRHMRPIVERGHVHIAQPPLYGLVEGADTTYLLDDAALDREAVRRGIEGATLRPLGREGRELSGDELERVVRAAADDARRIEAIDRSVRNPVLSGAIAVSGALDPAVWDDPTRLEKAAAWLAARAAAVEGCEWSGRVDGGRLVFTRRRHGRRSTHEVHRTMCGGAQARELVARRKTLGAYIPRRVLVRGAIEDPVASPADLFGAVRARGLKGTTLQRYKGLGEMNAEQLWETTLDPTRRTLLRVRPSADDDGVVRTLMGTAPEGRREFLEETYGRARVDA